MSNFVVLSALFILTSCGPSDGSRSSDGGWRRLVRFRVAGGPGSLPRPFSARVLAAALMELSHRWIDRDPRPDSQAIEVCFHEMAWRGLAAER
jgi:hypothetical protein